MNIRKVTFKDYKKIKNLFSRNNLKILNFDRWKNIWIQNPAFKKNWVKGWVLEDKKKIVGHFGSFPTEYIFNHKTYTCSVLHGWVVDKIYRSQSVLLLKKFFMQTDSDFFLSTTTNFTASKIMTALNAKPVPVESLNYSRFIVLNTKNILNFFLRKKNIPFSKLISQSLSLLLNFIIKKKLVGWKTRYSIKNISKYNKIDKQFNLIWRQIIKNNKKILLFVRNKNWLQWHLNFLLKNKKAWVFLSKDNKKVNGYSICIESSNNKDGIKRALLIDLMLFKDTTEIPLSLINANIAEAKRRKCDIIEFRGFNKLTNSYINYFNPNKKKLSNNSFYYKSSNTKLDKILNKSNHWYPTYLDGDTIINY